LEVVTSPSAGSQVSYARDGAAWVYSTHVPTLFGNLSRKPDLDEAGLLAYAVLTPRDSPPFRGVETLGMGSRLVQRRTNTPYVSQWFIVDPTPPAGTVEQWVEQYCATLDEVLAVELPEDGNVSALMSAGLDSTMVVGSAAGILGPDRSITAMCLDPLPPVDGDGRTGNWLYTDLPDAMTMETMWPNVSVVGLRNEAMLTPLDVLPKVFDHNGMPVLNPSNTVWIYQAAIEAAHRGETVVLNGQTGNLNFSWQPIDPAFQLLAGGRAGPAVDALRVRSQYTGRPLWSELAREVARPPRRWVARQKQRRISHREVRTQALVSEAFPMIRADAMERVGLWGRLDETPFSPRRDSRGTWVPGRMTSGYQFIGLGVDPRIRPSDPLSAEPLVRLLASLPPEAFVGLGPDRCFARRTMRGRVPDTIRMRQERGKQAPDAEQWMRHHADMRDRLEELAADPAVSALIDVDGWLARMPSEKQKWTLGFDRTLGVALFAAWNRRWVPRMSQRSVGG
jgi:hypothetical protein